METTCEKFLIISLCFLERHDPEKIDSQKRAKSVESCQIRADLRITW